MEPKFSDGMVLIVEPETTATPGDYVIAVQNTVASFKQLIQDGDELLLKPLNPRYPIRPVGDAKIIGVVISAHTIFR